MRIIDKESLLTQEEVKRVVHYDPETGIFTWLTRRSQRVKVGDVAGTFANGYIKIRLRVNAVASWNRSEVLAGRMSNGAKVNVAAHRLAWFYVYGVWPKEQLDHIDNNKLNNRIVNLREATHTENLWNRPKKRTNTAGFKGVTRSGSATNPWAASIQVHKHKMHIGYYKTPEEASAAYETKAKELFGEFYRPPNLPKVIAPPNS